jgi:diacylglycerol kinase (ATP)
MSNPHKGRTGLERIVRATGYSIEGLQAAYRGESAFRQEFWLAAELLNSGIEAAIDRVSFELHDLSKRAKDLASAAVLLSLLLCGGIWLAALWHRFGSPA